MSIESKKVLVKVPHRISGFFQIFDEINGKKIINPEQIGSRGAGLTLTAYGYTRVSFIEERDSNFDQFKILINDQEQNESAVTSFYIYNYLKKRFKKPINVIIDHKFDLPVGCGFGASGAGALGASLGIANLMNLNLTYNESARIAHIAEVENRTGLGTVAGLWFGGLSIVLEAGYPFFVDKIFYPSNLRIICGTFGELKTKSILTDPVLSEKIKRAGKKSMDGLIKTPNIFTFMDESKKFVDNTEILHLLNLSECSELIDSLNKVKKVQASMNQLGKSVFCICFPEQIKLVLDVFESYKPEIEVFNLEICPTGPIIEF